MSRPANPLAPQPGRVTPQYDDAGIARAAAALVAFGTIHVAYPPQQAIAGRIEVLRQRSLGKRGYPLTGLRLSQLSQAGKTRTFTEYRRQLMSRTLLATGASNPYQVLYLGLEVRVTVKGTPNVLTAPARTSATVVFGSRMDAWSGSTTCE